MGSGDRKPEYPLDLNRQPLFTCHAMREFRGFLALVRWDFVLEILQQADFAVAVTVLNNVDGKHMSDYYHYYP